LPRRLVVNGGFTVDDGYHRYLEQQARRLGFADLPSCVPALLDDGWSIPSSPPPSQPFAAPSPTTTSASHPSRAARSAAPARRRAGSRTQASCLATADHAIGRGRQRPAHYPTWHKLPKP